jgi:ankyrin repeat protein
MVIFLIYFLIELWTPLQIACYHGFYKLVAILLSEPRTLPNFTTSASADLPQVIAQKMALLYKDSPIEATPGVNYLKCIELLEDCDTLRNKIKFPRAREMLKKFDR